MAKKTNLRTVKNIVKKYALLLKENIKVKNVYLFGSYADKRANEYSDIDVAVVSDKFSGDPVDDMVYLMRFCDGIDLRIEPHPFTTEDFNEESNPFIKEIIKKGIKIL